MARGPSSQRTVGFAPEVRSIREPREDERSVMSHFARHAARCPHCVDPYASFKADKPLCDRGITLAKDVANYLFAKGGKPFSIIDRQAGERIQVQVPAGMEAVSLLIKAIDRGLVLTRRPVIVVPEKVEVEIDRSTYRAEPATIKVSRRKDYPEEKHYRDRDFDIVEIVPRTREKNDKVYHSQRTEDRSRHERRERPKSVIYPEERKGSLYQRDEEEKRQRRRYEQEPIVIVAEPRSQRYTSRR